VNDYNHHNLMDCIGVSAFMHICRRPADHGQTARSWRCIICQQELHSRHRMRVNSTFA
jgi:hypothetical protein